MMMGGVVAVEIRKVTVSAMYDKIGKLSVKSLTETNSGKLISLVSSDLFQIERPISIMFMVFVIPLLNIVVAVIIGYTEGFIYAITTFVLWLIMMLLQWLTTRKLKQYQMQLGMINDKRMKAVNDMVSGIRTIKCYAWELHYMKKIDKIRKEHKKILYKFNFIGGIGTAVYNNLGLVAVLVILFPKWY